MKIKRPLPSFLIALVLLLSFCLCLPCAAESSTFIITARETEEEDTGLPDETETDTESGDAAESETDTDTGAETTRESTPRNPVKKDSQKTEETTGEAVDEGWVPTSASLVRWVTRAFNEKWEYVVGGIEPGAVDCSGMIYAFLKASGAPYKLRATYDFVSAAYYGGDMTTFTGLPGVVLYYPGHVGVYIGGDTVVEALNEDVDVICSSLSVDDRWQAWIMVPGIDYGDSAEAQAARQWYFDLVFTETEEPVEATEAGTTTGGTGTKVKKPELSAPHPVVKASVSGQAVAEPEKGFIATWLPDLICLSAFAAVCVIAAVQYLKGKKKKKE